jgi:O-antigen/teichoic acid export membrane protein
LGTDTAVYGVSTILGRFLTFLLTPIYANILAPSDLGIVATVYAYVAFMNVVYGYGMESAYMKYRATVDLGSKKEIFTVPFLSVAATSFSFSAIISLQSDGILRLINLSPSEDAIIHYSALILCLDAVALIPFASLRMAGKAKQFAFIKLAGIALNVVCNVLLLVKYHMGIEGIFLSGVISSAFTLVLLLPTVASNISFARVGGLYKALLYFGLPTVPAGIASMMIQVINRPILEALTGKTTVGVFQANYRLGIFMMLIVSMFDFAWRPFFLSHAHEPDAKQMFARIFTYFVLLVTGAFLIMSFFVEDVVKIPILLGHSILPPPYWDGLSIVPVILLAYVFLGFSNNLVAGIYIEKQTKYLPIVTIAGAAVNVAANYILIPMIGMMGAAVATLMSYVIMSLCVYVIAQRFYLIRYEFGRIGKIAIAALVVFCLYMFMPAGPFALVWKCGLLLLFVFIMYRMKFFEPEELKWIARLFKVRGRQEGRADIPPDDGV